MNDLILKQLERWQHILKKLYIKLNQMKFLLSILGLILFNSCFVNINITFVTRYCRSLESMTWFTISQPLWAGFGRTAANQQTNVWEQIKVHRRWMKGNVSSNCQNIFCSVCGDKTRYFKPKHDFFLSLKGCSNFCLSFCYPEFQTRR